MGRPLRIDYPGGWYHVINRGAARQDIFFAEGDRVEFESLLGVAHERFGVRVHAYCLMTNHYHLLLECPDGGLSSAMHLIGSVYVRHLNERQGRDGPLFRDRFFAKAVTSDEYFARLVRYVHRNPLAFCAVDELRTYRWSSLPVYLGSQGRPEWLTTDTVLSMFAGVADLDQFVTAESTSAHGGSILDGPAWLAAVDLMIESALEDRVHANTSTAVAILLLDRLTGPEQAAVAAELAFPTPDAERMARTRARRRAQSNPVLFDIVDRVIDLAANGWCLAPSVRGDGQSAAA